MAFFPPWMCAAGSAGVREVVGTVWKDLINGFHFDP